MLIPFQGLRLLHGLPLGTASVGAGAGTTLCIFRMVLCTVAIQPIPSKSFFAQQSTSQHESATDVHTKALGE